jgi:hypothetical protein
MDFPYRALCHTPWPKTSRHQPANRLGTAERLGSRGVRCKECGEEPDIEADAAGWLAFFASTSRTTPTRPNQRVRANQQELQRCRGSDLDCDRIVPGR